MERTEGYEFQSFTERQETVRLREVEFADKTEREFEVLNLVE